MRNPASFGHIIRHDVFEHRKMTNHSSGPWGPTISADCGVVFFEKIHIRRDNRQTLYTFVLHTYSLRTMIPHSDGIHVRNGPLTTEKTLFVTCIMATVGWRRSRIPSLENFATHSHKSGPPLVGEEAGFPLSRILCTATQNPQHWRSSNMPG